MVDTITPEERRTWRNEHASWTGRDSDLVVRVRLMDALESAEVSKAEAEAENARLQKMVEWLADKLETAVSCPRGDMELVCPFDTSPGSEKCATIMDSMPNGEVWGHCWQEAARRAVAGEGEPS